MMKLRTICLCLLATCFFAAAAAFGQQPSMKQLVEKLATGANALLVVDLEQAKNSDIAKKENWFDSPFASVESGMAFLPADTNIVAFAAQMDFQQLVPAWTSGLLTMDSAPTLTAISKKLDGRIDAVAGHDVVLSSSDMFIFDVNPQTLATYSPANRQMFVSWLTSVKQSQPSMVNEYLQGGIASAAAGTSVVMAFDLVNVVSPSQVLARAKNSAALEGNGIDAEKFSQLLGSLQGVQININLGTRIYTNVDIDFGSSAQFVAPVAKQLILEFVDQHGIRIENLGNWETKVAGNRVSFSGDLTKSGLRRLLSLFDMPEHHMTAAAPAAGAATDTAPKPDDMGTATKNYYDAVSSMIKGLRDDIGVGGQSSWKYQRWFRSYADKIDNLPIQNVDSDMLNFGASVSQAFRNISLQITTGRNSTRVADKDVMAYGSGSPAYRYRNIGWGYYGNNYGGWGYGFGPAGANIYGNAQTEAEKRDIRQRARSSVADSGAEIFTELQDQEQAIRREMTQKYPNAF